MIPPAPCESVLAVLERRRPPRIAYAPNYWQWFAQQRNHGLLPREVAHCQDQLEVIDYLGLDVLSRNLYCDERRGWSGGLCDVDWDGVEFEEQQHAEGFDLVTNRICRTRAGTLTERLRYVFRVSFAKTSSSLRALTFWLRDDMLSSHDLNALLLGCPGQGRFQATKRVGT